MDSLRLQMPLVGYYTGCLRNRSKAMNNYPKGFQEFMSYGLPMDLDSTNVRVSLVSIILANHLGKWMEGAETTKHWKQENRRREQRVVPSNLAKFKDLAVRSTKELVQAPPSYSQKGRGKHDKQPKDGV